MGTDESHAFDARKIWMSESAADPSEWSVVSLVTAVRAILEKGPTADDEGPTSELYPAAQQRRAFLRRLMDQLSDRGVDADSLVRYGLQRELISPILGGLLAAELLGAEVASSPSEMSGARLGAWRLAFGLEPPRPQPAPDPAERDSAATHKIRSALFDFVQTAGRGEGVITRWIVTEKLDRILALDAPTPLEVERLTSWKSPIDGDTRADYRWLVDRLSSTFLEHWQTTSLHREYSWQHGLSGSLFPMDIMAARVPPMSDLEAEIARRSVVDEPHGERGQRLVAQVERHARTFLAEGRAREAGALFEFVCLEDPTNATAFNNLGFCMIHESPESALKKLEEAHSLGYRPQVINVYNRVCCHLALERYRAAVREAEQYRDNSPDGRPVPATLWVLDTEGRWSLSSVRDTRAELRRLRRHARAKIQAPMPRREAVVGRDGGEG